MLQFERFTLENGLRVIVHEDHTTPMAAVNVLYDVGARDEDPERTGFAHLFEHLMFGGSVNIPSYDEPLQMAGGENNAYTTNDITNYYIQLPIQNLETAFWLESDRMLSLAFSEKSLDVQRKVVSEEFKEHYLNKPYGDAWHHLRLLAYKKHPYQWMTIGLNLKHIEDAQLDDVKAFFFKHYRPVNAVLCVAGNISVAQVKELAEKWFAPIPKGDKYERNLPAEPQQTTARTETITADVPVDALYKAWHIAGRLNPSYYAADLITEIMGNGYASRLYQRLVKEEQLFSNISCYHTGSLDPGLLVVEGKVREGKTLEEANAAVEKEISKLVTEGVTDNELQKAKNKIEAMIAFEDMSLLSRANNLAFYELLGDAAMINKEWDNYQAVTAEFLKETAANIFKKENSNTLFYKKKSTVAKQKVMKKILPVVLLLFVCAATFAQQQSNHVARRGPWNNFDSLFKSHIGNAYVPFDVTTLDGKRLTNQSCKGKVTVHNFWFEECGGCRGEIKCLNALYDSLKKDPDVVFAAITFDAKETLPQFVRTFKLNYPIATTSDQQECHRLNYGMGFPTTIILDKSGKVAMMKLGIAETESRLQLSMQQVYDKIAELKLTN